MVADEDIVIDEWMSAKEINAIGLSIRQLKMCFEGGVLCHLTREELQWLVLNAWSPELEAENDHSPSH